RSHRSAPRQLAEHWGHLLEAWACSPTRAKRSNSGLKLIIAVPSSTSARQEFSIGEHEPGLRAAVDCCREITVLSARNLRPSHDAVSPSSRRAELYALYFGSLFVVCRCLSFDKFRHSFARLPGGVAGNPIP